MLGRKSLLAVGAVVAGLLLPAPAMAQFEAVTDANLNLRVGPGVNYGVIDVIPYGDVVDVYGCLDQVAWCDVEWWGLRGWVSARYLVDIGTSVYLPQVYARIGVPIISFSFSTYHDRYYRDRPWYKKRDGHWRGRDWRHGDRPKRDRTKKRRDAERPQQQQLEVEPSRQQRQIERAKQERQKQLQKQLKEAERPRKQLEVEPSRQQREIERAKQKRQQQLQEAEQPRQGERKQRPQRVQEAEQPRKEKKSEKQGRSGSDGPPEEQLKERGQ